jgi:putative hydrolase of the HAD superfamily
VKSDDRFWNAIELVVFDVDGTLYAQTPLRMRMVLALSLHTLASGSLETLKVLKHFRRVREDLGSREAQNFESALFEETSKITGTSPERIAEIVHEWIEVRPLAYLKACRYSGLTEVFEGLRSRGIKIGVFSDYPANQKLKALALEADFVVSAEDATVRVLKPNPRGLIELMDQAGAPPSRTLMVGDRIDRDGEAAKRAGTQSLILSAKKRPGWSCFKSYEQAPFTLLRENPSPTTTDAKGAHPMKNLAVWIILALMLISLSLGIVILTVLQR